MCTFLDKPEEIEGTNSSLTVIILIIVGIIVFTILIVGAIMCYLKWKTDKNIQAHIKDRLKDQDIPFLYARPVGDSTLRNEYLDGADSCMTSGSGTGMPRLNEKTLAKQIDLIEPPIGKGRYGEVYRGTFRNNDVAVKISLTKDEASFIQETKIYVTTGLRHDNILVYYGSDTTSKNSCTSNWIVTEYHELGSLWDFLNYPTVSLDWPSSYRLILTALRGLLHLHSLVPGLQKKPRIAHRDVKSKNILVRNDGQRLSCVVADLGMAVTEQDVPHMKMNVDSNTRVGTKRYMSPEVLDLR